MSVPSSPQRLDRAALDRVLQRAAEMQLGEAEVGEGLTEREVLDLGRQVGIPAKFLQQAMLEERSRVALSRPATLLDAWVGPAEVTAQRVIQGDREAIERGLLQWMEKHELVSLQRQQPGRISWERLGGMAAALKRGTSVFSAQTTRFMLARAELVTATITPLEDGYLHVALSATLKETRGGFLGGAASITSVGLAGTIILVTLGAMALVAPVPLIGAAGAGYAVLRRYPPVARRVQLGLERILDFAERGAVKPAHQLPRRQPGIVELLSGEIRKALGPSAPPSPPPPTDSSPPR